MKVKTKVRLLSPIKYVDVDVDGITPPVRKHINKSIIGSMSIVLISGPSCLQELAILGPKRKMAVRRAI